MPIAPNFTSKLEQNWEITFLQCYPNGYLKYTDLCNILQLTAGLHAELGGISFSDMQVHHQAWVLSRMRVEISRLPRWRDMVTVKTWINSLENSRSIRCLEMYIGDEKIIGCETFWAVFNTKTRRPENLALPHEHFEKYPDRATSKAFGKIDFQHEMQTVGHYKVKLSDLDIVNHANSVKYLEWCLDVVDFTIVQNQKIDSFEMNYLKELSLNDTIEIKKKVSNNDIIFAIQREEKANFALQLHLK
ncbi:acyl-[acyl-carrier-protein] thioesterase [Flavobacterium sp. J49]|uniref:acyl-[acyl-carrier-protein] thioesterase n=1 Tax=Flavobacterium sp. J49 TaxID=2718534 RepID=UPI00159351C5|nr:acyl-ACP thioesterase domain-containing protein [Flavobacterium sp. J49]MBF6640745.1 acyl-[acyl-carrier-protein] thioesterase [Flavobacterium sp. J49]NIC01992.1 acyl-[acyl-carrier-protein] thioesterase [Flavobacterium sp. J49]